MILDDDALSRKLINTVLDRIDPAVETYHADCIAAANTLFADLKPDLLVTDWFLPDGTGADLLQGVGADYPGSQLIVITALPKPEVVEKSQALGARHILSKPFNLKVLEELFRQLMQDWKENRNDPVGGDPA